LSRTDDPAPLVDRYRISEGVEQMRIGILGCGLMAAALGGQWARAGHDVLVGGRSPSKAAELAEQIGATNGTLQEATAFGDVTLLAIRAEGIEETLHAIGAPDGTLSGRPLIDCTNAIVPGRFTLAVPAMAEQIAHLAVGAHVVKAFNLCADSVWRGTGTSVGPDDDGSVGLNNAESLRRDARQEYEGQPLGVPLCGDDPTVLEVVSRLVRDLGCVTVAGGGLARAALLEATAAFAIGIWAGGSDTRSLFPTLDRAFGTTPPSLR
jgi:predicted dinucleotide-binding enzyme